MDFIRPNQNHSFANWLRFLPYFEIEQEIKVTSTSFDEKCEISPITTKFSEDGGIKLHV